MTSVLHEHATLKMVQRYSFLISKHIIHATSKRPVTKNASSEGTICTFVLEYNTNQACLFIFVKTDISSIDWELTLHTVLDTCTFTQGTNC